MSFNRIGLGVLVLALLGVLGAFASRETKHKAESEAWKQERVKLEEDLKLNQSAKLSIETQLRKAMRTTKKTVPIILPNGQTAFVTEETSETTEEALSSMRQDFESRLEQSKRQLTDLEERLKKKRESSSKPAPRWAMLAEWDALAIGPQAFSLGAGINIGSLTIGALHPASLILAPRASVSLRF